MTVTARPWARTSKAGRRVTSRSSRRSPSRCGRTHGFLVLSGNLFDSALMKTSVISKDFRSRFLSNPGREGVFEAKAVVFDGPEDYHERINDPSLRSTTRRSCSSGAWAAWAIRARPRS